MLLDAVRDWQGVQFAWCLVVGDLRSAAEQAVCYETLDISVYAWPLILGVHELSRLLAPGVRGGDCGVGGVDYPCA